ncbi:hypothetical protein JHK85_007119 [Glycine max]|uniref:Reverse transcriptase zinc-binding domain-containing protein n=1 Tax=Glycine soja TaxID=3848 RepID=A0A0B2SPA0_GLYSO|nr:hypothetical protein JHK87_006762 [Glycine soja]KAG5054609.1 hypothetical protein JHK85_007119 [Glycine max]KAG5071714.1 hypothetical protein JHK86_006925 [Glycine max]KHN46653.1 hypothetical protein glysoja_041317 [Glycine soja]
MGKCVDGRWVSGFRWRREWFEWEKQRVEEFLHEINNANICGQGGDQWIWCVDSSNKFTVKFTYIALHDRRIGSHEVYEFKFLWQIKISQRVSLFIWRVLHDRLPTKITFIRGTSKFKKRV